MNSLNKEILSFIKKAGRKIRLNFIVNKGLVGLKYLLSLIYIFIILSLFFVIKDREILIGTFTLVGIIGILIFGIIKGPNKKKVALILDSKGLDERLSTALEFLNEEDKVSLSQREDTVKHIRKFDFKKLKIEIDRRELFKSLTILLICLLTMTIKTEATIKANDLKLFEVYKEDTIKTFEEEVKKIDENEKISKEEKEALKKVLEDTKKDILEAENKEELEKALERSELKLKEKEEELKEDEKSEVKSLKDRLFEKFNNEKKEKAQNDINNLMNELVKKEEGKELAKAILSEDEKELEEALANLREDIKNMTPDELNQLSKALEKAASEIESSELKEALEEASKDLKKGDIDASKLKEAISKTQGKAKGEGEGSEQGEEAGESSGEGDGEGQGQGQGQGSSQGGQGQGQGQGGNGIGGGANEGSNIGQEGEDEKAPGLEIFIPGREVGSDENLQGGSNEEGDSHTIETESGVNLDGEKVEYEKVVGDYTNSALESINNSNMPEGLKNIIKDYFEGLN